MLTMIISRDGFIPVEKDDMVIVIKKGEKEQRIAHLDSLIPKDQAQYDEITVLFDIVHGKPTLKLVKG